MKNLYIISGPNGSGKTTASYTILPEILNCNEFVNADEIAKGLSPFQPDKVSIQAGRLMLKRINRLLDSGVDFAFETTLATRGYTKFIQKAQKLGYSVTLLFLWLNSEELAINRVKVRVAEGGHNIPEDVVRRRYKKGLFNFFNLYLPILDEWLFVNNSGKNYKIIANGVLDNINIKNNNIWSLLKDKYDERKN